VVVVASIAHHGGDESVLEGNPASSYRPEKAYSNSKLANLLFFRELHRRAAEASSKLVATAAHPGVSATNLVSSPDGMGANVVLRGIGRYVLPLFFQSAAAGANPSLWAAVYAEPGSYVGPQRFGEARGRLGTARLSRHARNDDLARALWERSEELTGVGYDFTG
jgi:NAD(P)-dependent dehydrogenase (short-subunit alcohol dehydrogenase family)